MTTNKSISRNIFIASRILGALFLVAILCFFGILRVFPFPIEAIKNINYSTAVYDKDGQLLSAFTNSDGRWIFPVSLSELNQNFIRATLAIEDRRFFLHKGVDPVAVLRAAFQNITNGRKISGASTLSMQTIRLLENRPRTLSNKVIEAVHAVYLESCYSKDDILQLYFELAPYGGNIHGVKAAARKYFNKMPKELTLSESALLAGLPQSPSRLRPDRYPERAKKRREMVLKSLLRDKVIDEKAFMVASSDAISIDRYVIPSEAPHLSALVRKTHVGESVVSTIDSKIQQFAENDLREAVEHLKTARISNGAMVVIENATGKVRAMVGSVDFSSTTDFGQVNGAMSLRSPGSALKPFTYALGFERGLYSTASQIDDSPVRYGEYLPKNYDEDFHGMVTIREALAESLNIPAVEVLDRVGYGSLYSLLRQSGLTTLKRSPEAYGLALTLGAPEVRLLELTNAYAMLARLGIYRQAVFIEGASVSQGHRVLSEGSAYMVADILSDVGRLQSIGIYRNDKIVPRVAFKTGTSYGQRDAWTFAYNREYTVGVWLGNFSGASSKSLVGLEVATPVAVKLFDWLYAEKTVAWYDRPSSIGLRGENDLFVKTVALLGAETVAVSDKDKPRIISPAGGAAYFISGPEGTLQEMPFSARPGPGVSELYWFLNGQLLSHALPGEKVFWGMKPGQYQLTCADNFGRSTTVAFAIR